MVDTASDLGVLEPDLFLDSMSMWKEVLLISPGIS